MTYREFHLVDVENLLGSPYFGAPDVVGLRAVYDRVTRTMATAQVVVGASSAEGLIEAGIGWTGARLVWQAGPDGADLALMNIGIHERIATRFTRIVIGSGDGIFASLAAGFQAAGCQVTVVSRRNGLSRKLRLAASDVSYLPPMAPIAMHAIWGAA